MPGLTRQSIYLSKMMDARIKSAHDDGGFHQKQKSSNGHGGVGRAVKDNNCCRYHERHGLWVPAFAGTPPRDVAVAVTAFRFHRHCEERSDEAIQLLLRGLPDRFARNAR